MKIDLKLGLPANVTVVSNEFIDQYMAAANGEYVKVFLYLLRHEREELDLASIAAAVLIAGQVVDNPRIQSCVKLDATDLGSGKLPFYPYIIDVIILYQGKRGAHATAHPCLLAIEDGVAPHDVSTDIIAVPSLADSVERHFNVV